MFLNVLFRFLEVKKLTLVSDCSRRFDVSASKSIKWLNGLLKSGTISASFELPNTCSISDLR